MGLADWTFVNNLPAQAVISLEITTPIVGNGSLKSVQSGTSVNAWNCYLSTLAKGFTKGRIRTLMRYDIRPGTTGPGNGPNDGAGIICLQSVLGPATATGNAYSFRLSHIASGPGTLNWALYKHTAQTLLAAPSTTLVSTSTETTVIVGDYWPMQLEWNVDVAGLGGTRLTASRGTRNSQDFNTLSVIYDYLDTSTPHIVSVAEGLCFSHPIAQSVTVTALFDRTTIYVLS